MIRKFIEKRIFWKIYCIFHVLMHQKKGLSVWNNDVDINKKISSLCWACLATSFLALLWVSFPAIPPKTTVSSPLNNTSIVCSQLVWMYRQRNAKPIQFQTGSRYFSCFLSMHQQLSPSLFPLLLLVWGTWPSEGCRMPYSHFMQGLI